MSCVVNIYVSDSDKLRIYMKVNAKKKLVTRMG